MQIHTQRSRNSHAVIGGAKQIMGISDSAEFFHILSSTLYSRSKRLWFVLETVCNAWDTHIDSNPAKTKPSTITVSEEQSPFIDCGCGIPKDLIGPIYSVYGASTKRTIAMPLASVWAASPHL
jgi:hypothetical protein